MITINGERGLEEVESWEEITELPGFTESLDPAKKQLKEIIGRYIFRDKKPCGLSTCHQPHARGYIVTTKSGEVTNIGNICGKRHFGVEFEEFSRIFNQTITDFHNRQNLASFLFRIDQLKVDLDLIRSELHGADWVYKVSQALVTNNHGCPGTIVSQVGKMLRMRNGEIRTNRVATEKETKELEVMASRSLPRPQYIEESKGYLRGISCLYHEFDIRDILVHDLEPNLEKLADFDVDAASSTELNNWAKWCQEYEQKIERLHAAVQAGRELLTRRNIVQLSIFIDKPSEIREFRKWLTSLPDV